MISRLYTVLVFIAVVFVDGCVINLRCDFLAIEKKLLNFNSGHEWYDDSESTEKKEMFPIDK